MNKLWWTGAEAFQSNLPASERHRVMHLMQLTRFPADKVVYSSALPGDVIYLVQEGRVQLLQNTPAQTRRPLTELSRGDVFGSLGLVEGGFRDSLALTIEPTSMLVLRKRNFEQLMKYFPATGAMLVEFLQQEIAAQMKQRSFRQQRHSYRRLCRLLLHFLDHPHYNIGGKAVRMHDDTRELAAQLGTRPDVLSQCLDRLVAAGIVERHHHELRLKDRARLEAEA